MRNAISPEFIRRCSGSGCRGCGGQGLAAILDYGPMPASDALLDAPGPTTDRAPLELAFCARCGLLQVLETLPPGQLFGADYLYLSSCSEDWLRHCRANVENLVARFGLGRDHRVVEIASNDGYLLQYFRDHDIPVLGVDPAPVPARHAEERGIPTVNAFFTRELARQLAREGQADLVISNNVLAHVADLHDFIAGVRDLLAPSGNWVVEVPYAGDLAERCAFDTVYHEHLCYFSLSALHRLLSGHGLHVNDLERLGTHGGSLRLYVSRAERTEQRVADLLRWESKAGLRQASYFLEFAARARATARDIAALIGDLAARGRRIAAYGAAAKGTMLLNCLGPAARHVEFAADRNPHKHGKWIPGVEVPVLPAEEIERQRPDYLLLLPWNLRDEILRQQHGYLQSGGRFIVPLPRPEVIARSGT